MPDTARDLGVDPNDLAQNLDGSARYLLMILDQFGDGALALAAYNVGPEAVTSRFSFRTSAYLPACGVTPDN